MTDTKTGLFRVRRGLFGRSILQELRNYPYQEPTGPIDSSQRLVVWEDVPFSKAPRALISQFRQDLAVENVGDKLRGVESDV